MLPSSPSISAEITRAPNGSGRAAARPMRVARPMMRCVRCGGKSQKAALTTSGATRRMAAAFRRALQHLLPLMPPGAARASAAQLRPAALLSAPLPQSFVVVSRHPLVSQQPAARGAAARLGAARVAASPAGRMELGAGPSGRLQNLHRHFIADSPSLGGFSPRRGGSLASPLRQGLRASTADESAPDGSREMATAAQRAQSPAADESMLTARACARPAPSGHTRQHHHNPHRPVSCLWCPKLLPAAWFAQFVTPHADVASALSRLRAGRGAQAAPERVRDRLPRLLREVRAGG